MGRINLDPLMIFPDGSYLVISTRCSKEGDFSCALYSADVEEDDQVAFKMVSDHAAASTCMSAQEQAYRYALRLYPGTAEVLKRPPYLIWSGP